MATDLAGIMSTLLGGNTLSALSKQSGVKADDLTKILSSALPSLLQGANKQSNDAKTAAGFASALEQHAKTDTGSLASFFKNVDTTDGSKIVQHLLGTSTNKKTDEIAKSSGIDPKTVATVMAFAAPLMMSLIGKQATAKKEEKKAETNTTASIAQSLLSNIDVGDILKGLLK